MIPSAVNHIPILSDVEDTGYAAFNLKTQGSVVFAKLYKNVKPDIFFDNLFYVKVDADEDILYDLYQSVDDNVTGYMSVDAFCFLLKGLGVSDASVSEVRAVLIRAAGQNYTLDIPTLSLNREFAGTDETKTWVDRTLGDKAAQAALNFPEVPRERWADRPSRQSEDPVSFLKRVYEPWLAAKGFRAHLRRGLDPQLYNALGAHVRRHGIPEGLESFFSERTDHRQLANDIALESFGIDEPRDAFKHALDRREGGRLYMAARSRNRRSTGERN